MSSRHPQLSDGRVAAVFASPGRRTRQEADNLVEALFGFGKETRPKLGAAKLVSQQYTLVTSKCALPECVIIFLYTFFLTDGSQMTVRLSVRDLRAVLGLSPP